MGFGTAQLLRPELGGSKGGSVGIGPNLNAGFVGVELDGDRNAGLVISLLEGRSYSKAGCLTSDLDENNGFLGGSGLVEISRAGFVGSGLDE
jgi:hypothetical protein